MTMLVVKLPTLTIKRRKPMETKEKKLVLWYKKKWKLFEAEYYLHLKMYSYLNIC